ncbi:acyl-CoA synthetase (AMP-forming)/AMP-acid ligase II [Rhodococcus sp. LBL1]|nr:acyl-CoA synthetase (AMP-forming)/AMP-acid ligase II [Rhodococcus sp. LBL1]MDH6684801.1 acyl-CoA synthetase (AMP-forming)/AMP-acid ligase II [Rhodococcus sp. LBL2]
MSIASVVRVAAERFGPDVAVEDGTTSLTFAELSDRVHRLAAGLAQVGLTPGSTVLVLLPNSTAAVEVDLALTIGGYVRVALNPRVGERDWARIMEDCAPAALIFDPAVAGAREFALQALAEIVIAAGSGGDDLTLDDVVARAPEVGSLPDPDPESLCALHYSSGTTGVPKGAQRSHANRLASLRAMREHVLAGTLDGPEPPVFVHAGPIIHTSGLFVLPFIEAGGRQVLLDHARPADVIAAVERHGATHTALVPTVVARMLDFDDAQLSPMRRMRMLAYAGAPMPVEHIRQAYHRITPNLVQYYGMVEAIPPLTVLDAADHRRGVTDDPDLLGSVGRPCSGIEIEFRNGDRPVADGEIGELVVGGPAVSPGYHNAGARTDLGKSHADGVLHSGDLGFRAATGYLHLTGRSKDMIITGGYNVYPREVEEAISAVAGVNDVVAVGLPDPLWGQRIVAAYTVEVGAALDDASVLTESRHRLPDYKRPKSVHRVDALPLTPLGKVDRASATRMLEHITQEASTGSTN